METLLGKSISASVKEPDETYQLFCSVLKLMRKYEVAAALGLHRNTVLRWMTKRSVPKSYHDDFLRLAGRSLARRKKEMPGTAKNAARARDQFYTKPDVAKSCIDKLFFVARQLKLDLRQSWFIEPAAGCGWFYDKLPVDRRIGIDIEPRARSLKGKNLLCCDYLEWQPAVTERRYVVIGNPPFGLRGHLALQFINHSVKFADIVAFILPQLFASDGKGVPGKRVKTYQLAHSHPLPPNSFEYPNGQSVNVNTVFQVWTKVNTNYIQRKPPSTCATFIKIYSLSNGGTPASTRNIHMIDKCDVYLPSTCFSRMQAYPFFNELPHRRGYGVLIHPSKYKSAIKKLLLEHHWQQTAFPSTNGAYNLRSSLISGVVMQAGYKDDIEQFEDNYLQARESIAKYLKSRGNPHDI